MRAERSRGRLDRSASLSGDSGVHPPSASSMRASFRDHIGLAEHIHRKSFEVKEMHELLVERLRGIGEKEEASREDDREWCREKSDQNLINLNELYTTKNRRHIAPHKLTE